MGFFSNLRWRLGRGVSPLEDRLLQETAAVLITAARSVFSTQVKAVRNVRRMEHGTTSFFYAGAPGDPAPDGLASFPLGQGRELEIASIRFRLPDKPTSWRARVWLVGGYLSSIEFRPGAKGIWGRSDIEVLQADPVNDPTVPRPMPDDDETIPESSLTGWVADWARDYALEDVLVPVPQGELTTDFELKLDALPSDFRELLTVTDGFAVTAGGATTVAIYGLRDIYHVALEDDDYLTVGYVMEDGAGVGELLVKEESTDPFVYLSLYEAPVVAGGSLREAVERVLGGWRG